MSKISIYLSDDLKGRMDEANFVNWSNVAQRAFETHLATGCGITVIDRIRLSKAALVGDGRGTWAYDGRQWAEKFADYEQLKEIGEADLDMIDCDPPADDALLRFLSGVLFGDDLPGNLKETEEFLAGTDVDVTRQDVRLYLEGVQAVWNEVKDQL